MSAVRTMRMGISVVLLASLVASASVTVVAQSDAVTAEPDDADRVASTVDGAASVAISTPPLAERVLFIGNSHTSYNGGIDWHIERMVASEDPPRPFSGDSETSSGATLKDHYEIDSPGRIPFGDYDVVVIQGHIPKSGSPRAEVFHDYGRRIDEIVRENGARTVFFMSWPHPDVPRVKLKDIVKAHRQISRELGADVAPAALAMQQVRRQRPDLELLASDGIHASWVGSYLASAVIYATLFDRSPEGLPYTFGVSEEDAAFLQKAAWDAVTSWNESLVTSD